MTKRLKVAFWNTVRDCMTTFLDVDAESAGRLVDSYRTEREKDEPGMTPGQRNLIYHSEPIHIASDLVGREPDRNESFSARYEALQQAQLENVSLRKPLPTANWSQEIPKAYLRPSRDVDHELQMVTVTAPPKRLLLKA